MGSLHLRQDEDLALFQEMRARERRKFLLPSSDESGASLSSKYDDELLNFSVSATTPSRKGNELLISDSEKNDYDWLLTPPGTPLFPSLDQDVPIIKLSQRRVLTRSVSASRTSRLSYPQDPSVKAHGGNPSPRRPSTASSTSSTVITGASRGRPSSPSVGSSPTLRSSSPCRPSTTPHGRTPSRGASRSLTPTLRGNNTSPASRAGPTSKQIRGKSLSPKLHPWEPSMQGFSGEPPPNLRTSLSNRSIQRGAPQGTPRPGNLQSRIECSQPQWQTHSRNVSGSWSLSNSQDQTSSFTSKGSIISSCDDDVEMAESVFSNSMKTLSSIDVLETVKITARSDSSTGRCILPAKRHTRSAIPSMDTALYTKSSTRKPFNRPVGHRRSSDNMFRPLMSSAPASSFYSTRPAVIHHGSANPPSGTFLALNGDVEHDMKLVLEDESNEEDMQAESDHGNTSPSESSVNPVGEDDGHHTNALHSGNIADVGLQVSKSKDFGVDTAEGLRATYMIQNGTDFGGPPVSSLLWKEERTSSSRFLDKGRIDDMSCLGTPILTDANNRMEVEMKDTSTLGQEHIGEQRKYAASCCSDVIQNTESKHHGKCNKMVVANQAHLSSISYENGRVDIPTTSSNCAVLQSGPLRHLSEMGSFRKQSGTKALSMRFYDSMINSEKSVSDLSTGSRGVGGSSTSNFGDHRNERSLLESALDALEPTFRVEAAMSMAAAGSTSRALSGEKLATHQEKESPRDLPGSIAMEDASCFINKNDLLDKVGRDPNYAEVVPRDVGSLAGDYTAKEVSLEQRDAISILGLCTAQILTDEEDGVQHHRGIADTRAVEVDKGHSRCTSGAVDNDKQDGRFSSHEIQEPPVPHLKRNVTYEEATDTILFCSSIIHELVYKAASTAVEEKEEACARPSKREFVALFGFSGSDYKSKERGKEAGTGDGAPRKRSVVRKTFSQVQRQRMVHQQTMAVTMRHSPTERIENAVMGSNAEMLPPVARRKGKKQGRKVACRCRCCIM